MARFIDGRMRDWEPRRDETQERYATEGTKSLRAALDGAGLTYGLASFPNRCTEVPVGTNLGVTLAFVDDTEGLVSRPDDGLGPYDVVVCVRGLDLGTVMDILRGGVRFGEGETA